MPTPRTSKTSYLGAKTPRDTLVGAKTPRDTLENSGLELTADFHVGYRPDLVFAEHGHVVEGE